MGFTEMVKLEAKKNSGFLCVACRNPFVEVHHIIPQKEGGPDTIENACPLCARCHDLIGGNPDKRKQLREMRDFQWELNAKTNERPDFVSLNQKLDEISVHLKASVHSQAEQQRAFAEIKSLYINHNQSSNVAISNATTFTGFEAVTGVSLRPIAPNES